MTWREHGADKGVPAARWCEFTEWSLRMSCAIRFGLATPTQTSMNLV